MSAVQSTEVTYEAGGVAMRGHLAWRDDISDPRPGILVVHEWWGRNDYACGRAEQLAGLGYVAMAVDMYGDARVAANPDEAGALMNGVLDDMAVGRARFEAALETLKNHPMVDEKRTGAIGFCFGGGVVVHMARSGTAINAVASFHGSLGLAVTDGPDAIDARVAAYNGERDKLVADEDVQAFVDEMEKIDAHYYLVQLPGALHGFSNPIATTNGEKYGLPLAYDEAADTVAWSHMQLLFRDVFRG